MANAKLGTKAVGSIVKLKVNGTAKEFIVVHQGKPSSIYDESCTGTWLLMKDIYEIRVWQSGNINKYESSDIHSYLNSTFLNLFDSNIKDAIKQVKIPYRKNGGSDGTDQSGANGLLCKIFLLSVYEIGFTTSDNSYFPVDGAKLSYFEAGTGSSALDKRIAYLNGSATAWWLRSPSNYSANYVLVVNSDGGYNEDYAFNSCGIRPALILPQDMEVDSSGNVTPPPPPATHKTLINGTVYTVQSGKCMVGGTVYNILKGRTLIGGTGYDITLPGIGIMVSTLSVGQSVYTKVNGTATEFIVVHQGKPSSIYDNSCNGTWLLMKDCYVSRAWHSSNVNKYESSDIHTYLNNTFLKLLDSNIQEAIKQVKLPYRQNGGSGGTDRNGANGLSTKIFLLSGYEVGWTTSDNSYFPVDGAKLDYFAASSGGNSKRIAYLNGSAANWWLRSPRTGNTNFVWYVLTNGSCNYGNASASNGVRPALILPSDALVDDEFNLVD